MKLIKYGAAILGAGAILFAGAFGYTVYGTIAAKEDAEEINALRQVNQIQQEQMLQLSKKANSLQDDMEQLTQLEIDLRRTAGIEEDEEASQQNEDESHTGQGGPYMQPDMQNIDDVLSMVGKQLAVRKASLEQLREKLKERKERMAELGAIGVASGGPGASMPSIWPANGFVSSPYGLRWGGSDFHPGMDIANDMGTPIVATADGTVTVAGWNSGGYGNMVDIDHGNGIMTRYGHASQVLVSAGQYVRKGQLIAYMGSTGFSTGPHVHYEVHVNGQAVNPVSYL